MNELPSKRRKATNVTVDADLLAEAKALGLNLSRTLEERLAELVKAERERRWKEENREAIDAYNRYIDENGIFGEAFRTW